MSTPVSGTINWQTPVNINSGDVVTAADLNNLNNDVAYLHARPWVIATQTGTGTAIGNPASQVLFGGTGSGTWTATSSTSAVGSINNSTGAFSVPIAGMYRITATLGVAATASTHWRLRIVGQTAAAAPVWQFSGNVVNGLAAAGNIDISTVSVLVPIGTASSSVPLGNARSFYLNFDHLAASSSGNIAALGTQASNFYPTTVQIEYIGASTGAY
jgi:hypothetical protein